MFVQIPRISAEYDAMQFAIAPLTIVASYGHKHDDIEVPGTVSVPPVLLPFEQRKAYFAEILARPALPIFREPSIGLDPYEQLELADFFISHISPARPIILSSCDAENIILRIMRRIRAGKLASADFMVNWIAKPYCYNLPVDEDGNFGMPWPEGFYEYRIKELFEDND